MNEFYLLKNIYSCVAMVIKKMIMQRPGLLQKKCNRHLGIIKGYALIIWRNT